MTKMTKRDFLLSLSSILSAAVLSGVSVPEVVGWADDGIDDFDGESESSDSVAFSQCTMLNVELVKRRAVQ